MRRRDRKHCLHASSAGYGECPGGSRTIMPSPLTFHCSSSSLSLTLAVLKQQCLAMLQLLVLLVLIIFSIIATPGSCNRTCVAPTAHML